MLKRLKGKRQQEFYNVLDRFNLIKGENASKESLISAYPELKVTYERYRSKAPRKRYVDFNQGTDARYVTDELMKLMSEIPIRPLRIAFDYWGMRKQYENAVRLAAKYGIDELSNYILYNFKDTPNELFLRLQINVHLSEELNISIYSFPMKYIPLFGEEAKDRFYIGTKWNRKFIRAIQSILNVTKGIVAPGRTFFEKAFGGNIEQFQELLYMPENYIIYRYFFDRKGITAKWRDLFHSSLTPEEKAIAVEIIEANDFNDLQSKSSNPKILRLLEHYTVKKEHVAEVDETDVEYQNTKYQFDKLIKEDPFKKLTLTYDFET